jgi:DNA polymerase-1
VSKRKGLKNPYPVPARQCYIPRPNSVLFMVDYSGIEMRVAVQCSGSARLIKLLHDDFDFHSACAESFFGKRFTDEKDKEIKKMLRSAAKNARFAMLYGGGIKTVASTLLLSIKEAKYGKDCDRERFPEFYDLMDDCSSFAREHGYIKTLFGRKLNVPRHKSYVATDYRVQGTAAEVFKRGEVKVDKYLKENYPDIRLLVPVHDELMGDMPRKYLQHKFKIMKEIENRMINIERITVPLSVEWKMSSTTWDGAKEVKVEC